MKPFSNENLAVNCLTVIEEELNDEVSNVWMLLIIAQYSNSILLNSICRLICREQRGKRGHEENMSLRAGKSQNQIPANH